MGDYHNNTGSSSSRRSSFLLLSFVLEVLVLGGNVVDGAMLGRVRRDLETQRSIFFQNNSGRRVDVMWVNVHANPETFHSQNGGEGYAYGGDTHILSYVGHTFEVRELPSKKTGKCRYDDECQKARFTVNDQENQHFIVDKSFQVTHEDDRQQAYALAQSIFEECHKDAVNDDKSLSPAEAIEAVTVCMEQRVNMTMAVKQEERDFQSSLRVQMAQDLIPYACGDNNFTATAEVQNVTFSHRTALDDSNTMNHHTKRYNVKILHHLPTSEVSMIEDFATPEECKAVEAYVDSEGKVSFWSMTDETAQGIQLLALAQKMYQLAQSRLNWKDLKFTDMDEIGIPLFEAMIYEGEAINAPTHMCVGEQKDYEEDRNAGKCRLMGDKPLVVETKKLAVEKDTQLAQIYLFCEEPKTLGALYIPYAGVYVKPKVGKLVMAINRRLDNDEFDGYVTESHLCPNHHVYMHTIESRSA